ncbi:MAG: EAL domain-containing protein [Hyphomicrobiales bacterium]|nr:EAL domain-containing protein [Hyphomicrobiales bacterium]
MNAHFAPSEAEIDAAFDRCEFAVVYQPQVELRTDRIIGAEALVRWNHPARGLLGPDYFLESVFQHGLARRLSTWVLTQACRDALAWNDIRVAVNLSPSQFADPGLAAHILPIARMSGLPLNRLEVEIVETALFDDTDEARKRIEELRTAGVSIALDDFGTGYSNLNRLQHMPFDKIKIDKAFIDGLPEMRSVAILQAIVALVRALGMKALAEGVETPDQRRIVTATGCHYMQGFLFAKPMSAQELTALLKSRA